MRLDEHEFIDHVYYFHSVRPIDPALLVLLKVPLDEIPKEIIVKHFLEDLKKKEDERLKTIALLESSAGKKSVDIDTGNNNINSLNSGRGSYVNK
jgi:hypothetical protein